jgi:hypothetical protein
LSLPLQLEFPGPYLDKEKKFSDPRRSGQTSRPVDEEFPESEADPSAPRSQRQDPRRRGCYRPQAAQVPRGPSQRMPAHQKKVKVTIRFHSN